jgi:putative sigma-54 modulation protein
MQIIIQSPHATPTQELTAFINASVGELSHFYDRIETARVFLRIEKAKASDNKVFEISLALPGNDLFVKKHSDTFKDAVAKAIDAFEREIDKMKTKFQH